MAKKSEEKTHVVAKFSVYQVEVGDGYLEGIYGPFTEAEAEAYAEAGRALDEYATTYSVRPIQSPAL